ncbi:uncharacterized protein BCR38DRAFT_482624 [Pseudomassariella vexata]|uniref:MARVEL domain-containing protein n=1 Tax=Pseudomassariella vexata TaxID=1141098 RepID=A0A1Y2E820_9PEZI|nr:uncharacterized protein BCR38DRAFT_482624 [Pseudomassariella vexata]ORY66995.1 hypothetical protein BCR38DRAFT_482624 [Pseudomassariella vexata]
MLFAVFFAFWRFMQILTLIPTMGMLAYFVHGYVQVNALTPNYILVLFIVSVLALAWAIFTLFSYHRSSTNALFVSVIDLGFVGAFIAAVWYLRFIAKADCTHIQRGDTYDASFGIFGSASINGLDVSTDKTCAMLKACFAFGIMNCIFFFFTAVLAWFHGDRTATSDRKSYVHETHYHRHGHRHSRSPHSRRSSHSHRRVYV